MGAEKGLLPRGEMRVLPEVETKKIVRAWIIFVFLSSVLSVDPVWETFLFSMLAAWKMCRLFLLRRSA